MSLSALYLHIYVFEGTSAMKFGKKKQKIKNTGSYAVQGHRGRYQSKARMQLPISD